MAEHGRFRISWVLLGELAVGPAPRAVRHLDRLESEGVKAVLSLCSPGEACLPEELEQRFVHRRVWLPDHRAGRLPELGELNTALVSLSELSQQGPVYVHCVAAMERSPLLCLAWLVRFHGLEPLAALDYLMQVHPGTNPLPGQLRLLAELESTPTHADAAEAPRSEC